MSAASLETTLDLWASSLRAVKERMRPLFTQDRVAASAHAFLDGLLGPERRKTGWMRAEAAGDPGPWRQQAILGRTHWDAEALRDVVRDYAIETLSSPPTERLRPTRSLACWRRWAACPLAGEPCPNSSFSRRQPTGRAATCAAHLSTP